MKIRGDSLFRWAFGVTLVSVVALGACRSSPGAGVGSVLPSFEVKVNAGLVSGTGSLPPFADGAPRPLAVVTDKSGKQTSFVENELMVELATPEELAVFLARWHGTVLATDSPRSAGIDADPSYLVRVRTEGADLSKLGDNLSRLNPGGGSAITVSSEAARRLIAAAAETAMAGKHVGINFLTTSTGFQDEKVAEAPTSSRHLTDNYGSTVELWNPNPFTWVYMKSGGNLNIGVAPAWSLLERIGAFDRKVKIAVIDGGFGLGDDFPSPYEQNGASLAAHDPTGPNKNPCTGDQPCPWHGWNVVNAAMGQVNNGIGAAGPAGPIAKLLAIRRTADVFNNIQAITTALISGANVINMSFVFRVPATISWSMIPFDLATLRAHGAGKLLVAGAGNDDEDINDEDCFIGCWEAAWIAPCENGGVLCVGAMDGGSPKRRTNSNYGGDELDIWGPGSLWVGGDLADDRPHVFTATSAASPFIAGVAALIWAANPGLSNDGVERVMYETAHHGGAGQIERWPNVYAAVVRALGGTPPTITIALGVAEVFAACQTQYRLTATVTDPDPGPPPTVTWTSDVDHLLGTGTTITRALSDGTHNITATALDGTGLATRSNALVLSVSGAATPNGPQPTVSIISLTNHQTFAANQAVTFEASVFDPASASAALVPSNVRWDSSKDGDLGAGQRVFRMLTPGTHYITVHYTGACGRMADDQRVIDVTVAVPDAPPNMTITTPSTNDLVRYADVSGQACLAVGGFGFDEEDRDFVTNQWWETNRSDLQVKVLSFDQNATVCLSLARDAAPTKHEIRLVGVDQTGHQGYSAPLRVTVLAGLR